MLHWVARQAMGKSTTHARCSKEGFPQRLPFWVSFLPVPEWWRCNAGNSKSHPLCPPDSGFIVGWFFGFVLTKKKETRPSKIPQQNKNSKTSEKLTCTFSQNPQKSKNIKITTQNPSKINQNHQKSPKIIKNPSKSIKIEEKTQKISKKHKVKGKTT